MSSTFDSGDGQKSNRGHRKGGIVNVMAGVRT